MNSQVKTGMLPSTEIVEVLLQNLSDFPVRGRDYLALFCFSEF